MWVVKMDRSVEVNQRVITIYHPVFKFLSPLLYVCACIYIYTNPFTLARCNTRSIFKYTLTGLNSEFSFLPYQV